MIDKEKLIDLIDKGIYESEKSLNYIKNKYPKSNIDSESMQYQRGKIISLQYLKDDILSGYFDIGFSYDKYNKFNVNDLISESY